jgi:ferric-dicitrate binding protein FerR (iron transport regulator)
VINSSFGASLTSIAKLPEGSEHSLNDPFAVKRKRWKLLIALLVLLLAAGALWRTGTLDVWWDRMSTGETATEVEEPTQTKD